MPCHVSCLTWQTTRWAPTNHVFHNACDVIRREVLGTDILEQQCKQTKVLWMILTACVWKNVKRRDCEIFLGVRAHKTIPLPCCCVCRGTGKISHCCDLSTTFGTSHLSWQGKKFSHAFLPLVLCVRLSVRTSYGVPNEALVRHPTSVGLGWLCVVWIHFYYF